jgi:hypothetical protein
MRHAHGPGDLAERATEVVQLKCVLLKAPALLHVPDASFVSFFPPDRSLRWGFRASSFGKELRRAVSAVIVGSHVT